MKTFTEWMKTEAFPDKRQYAFPQQQAPQQISLSSFADKVGDPDWHQLYDVFVQQHQKHSNDPKVMELGQALYQAAQSNNMSSLKPFVQQYLKAQRI